jgi:MYXO-CTERM domain-containing protein
MSNAAGNTVATNTGDQTNSSCQCALSGPGSERGKSSVAGAALAIFGLLRQRRARSRSRVRAAYRDGGMTAR